MSRLRFIVPVARVAAALALAALVIKIAPTPTDLAALQSATYGAPAAAAPRTR